MSAARIIIVIVGILLPYIVPMLRGAPLVDQSTDIGDLLLLGAFNAIAWVSIVAISFLYRRPEPLLFPSFLGFGFLIWAHYSFNVTSDTWAGVALIFIPIYALLPILVGGVFGYMLDRRLRRYA